MVPKGFAHCQPSRPEAEEPKMYGGRSFRPHPSFTDHFRKLFAEVRAGLLPGVTDESWLQWVPRARHSGCMASV